MNLCLPWILILLSLLLKVCNCVGENNQILYCHGGYYCSFLFFRFNDAETRSKGFILLGKFASAGLQHHSLSLLPKSSQDEPSENLKAFLHFVPSCTLFLSFDLHLHKGSQNAKMLDHSTGVLPLHKLLGCSFVRLIPSCLSASPAPPTPQSPNPTSPSQTSLSPHYTQLPL